MLGLDEAGDGALVLLLPALSSISTRGEMHPLMERLASQFRVVAIDWPGFGTRSRPNVRWTPDALSTFLEHVLEQVVGRPHGIVAAGHAASYVLDCASRRSGITDRLVLIAPTWRGPLPTVAGGERPFFAKIRSAIEMPGIGSLLYRLNVNSFVVGKMVAGHVYSDPTWLSGERLIEKRQVMDAPGARFASAAFVTGALDRVSSRADFWRSLRALPFRYSLFMVPRRRRGPEPRWMLLLRCLAFGPSDYRVANYQCTKNFRMRSHRSWDHSCRIDHLTSGPRRHWGL